MEEITRREEKQREIRTGQKHRKAAVWVEEEGGEGKGARRAK